MDYSVTYNKDAEMLGNIANHLKSISHSLNKIAEHTVSEKEESWKLIDQRYGLEIDPLPGSKYEWVLVKYRSIGTKEIHKVPRIARLNGGRWQDETTMKFFETSDLPFVVTHWKPIPGDTFNAVYDNKGNIIQGVHSYD